MEVIGEVLGRAIRGVVSVPAASLSILSHYPPGVLTRDFYKGRFKSSKQRRPDTFLLEQCFIFLATTEQSFSQQDIFLSIYTVNTKGLSLMHILN